MQPRFAALESRVNAAVLGHLANAVATLAGGAPVRCIFDRDYEHAGVGALGMASTQPAITLASADVPANPVGQLVQVAGGRFAVAEHLPDGTGMSVLVLEVAAS